MAKELRSALSHIKLSSEGVYVQASTLGSLEALLEFLRTSKIPVRIQFQSFEYKSIFVFGMQNAANSQYKYKQAIDE